MLLSNLRSFDGCTYFIAGVKANFPTTSSKQKLQQASVKLIVLIQSILVTTLFAAPWDRETPREPPQSYLGGARSVAFAISCKKQLLLTAGCTAVLMLYYLGYPSSSFDDDAETSESESCICWYESLPYDFCYRLPSNETIKGRRFNCVHAPYLEDLGLLLNTNTLDMTSEEMPTPAFLTAMSENHYYEGLTLIANIRGIWPQQKIIVYDLGLTTSSAKDLKKKCLVEVRIFPFERFPYYVKNLKEYRWKPLLIAMVLREFGAVWYMDTSVRWQQDRRDLVYREITCRRDKSMGFLRSLLSDGKFSENCKKPAFLLHAPSGHSIFATTNPGMYRYLPTNIEAIKKVSCMNHDASLAFVVRTDDSVEILKWYVLCALEKKCMAPPGAQLVCDFTKGRYEDYSNCHRYDQSAINILLANAYEYNITKYISRLGHEGAVISRKADFNLSEQNFSCTPQ